MDDTPHSSSFDWYAATLAAAITGPFAVWGLYVLLRPNYLAMAAIAAAFLSFVFWGFGKIKIG